MSDYLTSDELADLVGCKPNQRSVMSAWLTKNAWPYVVDRNGLPKAMRAYRDKRLGMEADVIEDRLAAGPNLDAFRDEWPRRRTKHRT